MFWARWFREVALSDNEPSAGRVLGVQGNLDVRTETLNAITFYEMGGVKSIGSVPPQTPNHLSILLLAFSALKTKLGLGRTDGPPTETFFWSAWFLLSLSLLILSIADHKKHPDAPIAPEHQKQGVRGVPTTGGA